MVVDEKATIYKANNEACRFLNLDQEQILGFHLNHKIPEDHWNILKSGFSGNEDDKKTFELPLVYGGTERLFLWSVAKFGQFQGGHLNLYTLQARDITLLRLYQKKISDIFASIPLGIFTVNASGVIEDAFSEYTKWILGRSDIAGKTLKDLLFEPAKETMDVITREGFKAIWSSLNRGIREFDVLAETFPKVFFYPLPHGLQDNAGRYIGLKVQSIVKNDRVMGLLIVIEDRTMIVEAEMMDEKSQLLQDRSIERALQLKKVDPELLTVSMNDMTQLFHDLGDCILTQSSDTFKNALHSIKANARLVGLTGLQKLAHSFETKLRESEDFSWEVVYTNMDTLLHEWREIVALRKAIAAPGDDYSNDSPSNDANKIQGRSAWKLYKDSNGDEKKRTEFELLLRARSKQPLGAVENTI
jgi:HPt (histidine-containing phosphotransfer) domain-containing protein/PAS domain-containing protein